MISPATSNCCPKGGNDVLKCQSKPAVMTTRTRLATIVKETCSQRSVIQVHPLGAGATKMPAPSVLGLGENIARAADRDDAPRLFWIVLDRGANARHMNVDRPVERIHLFTFDQVHQGVTRHDATGVFGKRQQQSELIPGERTRRAVEAHLA